MSNVLLAVEKDLMGNTINVKYGSIPWKGINSTQVDSIASNEVEIKNIRISDKGEVIHTKGDIRKYTTIVDEQIERRSYVVLARADNNGDIYFVSDGISNPVWVRSEDLKDKLLKEKIELANSKLSFSENGLRLTPTEEDFEQVDYSQTQMEYRKYLKSIK